MHEPPARPLMARLTHSLERATVLDGPAKAVAKRVRSTIPRGPLKDAISGTWLGHALHPVLTDVPIGAWTSATVLDLIGGRDARSGADRLGGHLSFARGIGVDQAAFEPPIEDWTDLAAGADVREDRPVGAQAGTRAVVLVRRGGRVPALHRRSVHPGGPPPAG